MRHKKTANYVSGCQRYSNNPQDSGKGGLLGTCRYHSSNDGDP